jgi:hypothetical protein
MKIPSQAFAMLLSCAALALSAQASKFIKKNADGTANILFSNTQIEKGGEARNVLKSSFKASDSIYARAYFSAKFPALAGEEEGFIDVWVDGKHAKRLAFSNRDVKAGNDQMQIYLRNTDPSPDIKDEVWDGLAAGVHKVRIIVGHTKFMREGARASVQGDQVVVKRDDVHKAVYLSQSDFTFTKD